MANGHAAIIDGHDNHNRLVPVEAAKPPLSVSGTANGNSNGNNGNNDSQHGKQSGHKRSVSGSIMSRLSFMRTTSDAARPRSPSSPVPSSAYPSSARPSSGLYSSDISAVQDEEDDGHEHELEHEHSHHRTEHAHSATATEPPVSSASVESAMALSQRLAKQRKRKGSLRKTALLGTGRLAGRERKNSLLRAKAADEASTLPAPVQTAGLPLSHSLSSHSRSHPHSNSHPQPIAPSHLPAPLDHHGHPDQAESLSRSLTYSSPMSLDKSERDGDGPLDPSHPKKLSLDTVQRANTLSAPTTTATTSTLASPIISPTSQSYTSTTDDDDSLTLPDSALKRPPMPGSGSYFPSQQPLTRRRSSKKPPSPLSAIPVNAYGADEEYDYSETEWWGWVVLIVTWIVFVVGMGSCFGLWSWAWDVGETPYAPPELEDDPTLPIVGYYPALIILTGVMAWVWVVVAWVGMKYFKHAKMAGEDV